MEVIDLISPLLIFPIFPCSCLVLFTASFISWVCSAALVLNHISLLLFTPVIFSLYNLIVVHFFSNTLVHSCSQWFPVTSHFCFSFYSGHTIAVFTHEPREVQENVRTLLHVWKQLLTDWRLIILNVFLDFFLSSSMQYQKIDCDCLFPSRSVLFTWLRPAGCWICCSSWYRTIVRTRTAIRNTSTLNTSHRRHWMSAPTSWLRNWTIFPDTSPGTRSCVTVVV